LAPASTLQSHVLVHNSPRLLLGFCSGWIVASKTCLSPKLWFLWMWPYLDKRSLQVLCS
jgi:hypothetical protein